MTHTPSTAARYVVGIDLGTTHCAVAYSPVDATDIRVFDVPQLVAPGEVAPRPLLPSFLYLPAEGELAAHHRTLPWGEAADVVGELARRQGARSPMRLVASAKSWICHGGINRRAPVLPWGAPEGAPQISPFDAQARYLAHLRAAWDHAHPDAPLAEQEVVVTVPASFDEDARELTVDAAHAAGLPTVRVLEEPQAAFYDFLGTHETDLAGLIGDARLILVVDVGGGTTDLTLLRVLPGDGDPEIERIAVGGHLILGGDNMDAAVAHHLQQSAGIERLDATEWSALVQAARGAKERLLADDAPEEVSVAIQRRGSRLIGGTKTVPLTREDARRLLLDGFVPGTGPAEVAERKGRAGITTLGLPYATDPAIPRHVCAFLRRHARAATEAGARVVDGLPRPDLLLLNGGVFNAPAMEARLTEVLGGWFGAPVARLPHTSLDTAVARGAARYALGHRGMGRLITGGSARAWYVGIDGPDGRSQAFCAVPRGTEEGDTVDLPHRTFELVLGRPVAFPLYSYDGDRHDPPGGLIAIDEDLDRLPPLETVLRDDRPNHPEREKVTLSAELTESGTLALSLVTVSLPPRRWRLELGGSPSAPRPEGADASAPPPQEPLPEGFSRVRRRVEETFGKLKAGAQPRVAKTLRKDIEAAIGPRGEWSSTACRALADALIAHTEGRGRTPVHETHWLRLLGWALRPGFGAPGDAERLDRLWPLFEVGLAHPKDKALWAEWWILWRRVSPGLGPIRQRAIFDAVRPWLAGGPRPPGPHAHGQPEMLRMLSGLERLSPAQKEEIGGWVIDRIKKIGTWWPLGRLGARAPFHGDPQDAVPREVAAHWLATLDALDWATADGAAFAAVLIAAPAGNPDLDLSSAEREGVVQKLKGLDVPSRWTDLVTGAAALSAGDARRVFGDALPSGLRLT